MVVNRITKKTVKEQRKMTNAAIDYKVLNSSSCSKNSIKYFYGDDYIIDCMTPYKIYRYVFKVTTKSDPAKINQLKRDIESNTKKFMSLLERIRNNFNKDDRTLNAVRDEARELDEIIYIQKYNLKNIENRNTTVIADKPYQMFIIPRNQNERSFIENPLKEDKVVDEIAEKRDIISGKADEQEDEIEEHNIIENEEKNYVDADNVADIIDDEIEAADIEEVKEELTISAANKKSKKMLPSPKRKSAPKKKMRGGYITDVLINDLSKYSIEELIA